MQFSFKGDIDKTQILTNILNRIRKKNSQLKNKIEEVIDNNNKFKKKLILNKN